MKRLTCIICCFVILLCLCACTKQDTKIADPVSFYYLRVQEENDIHHGAEDSVLFPETREGLGLRGNTEALLKMYLKGPDSPLYVSPFPAGTELIAWTLEDSILSITLSDQFASLSGMDLTLACACLTRTFLELTGAESVEIRAETINIDGKESVIMSHENLILIDGTDLP